MNEPLRLSSTDSKAAHLLRAARAERPRDVAIARERAEAVAVAAVSAGSSSLSARWSLWKKLMVVLAVGGAPLALLERSPVRPMLDDSSYASATTAATTFAIRPVVPRGFRFDPEETRAAPPTHPSPSAGPKAAAAIAADQDADREREPEIELLRRARKQLKSNDPQAASRTLDRHHSLYRATAALGEEAAALRIEALAQLGDERGARANAAAFARTYPESPYAERVQAVLSRMSAIPASPR